MARSPRTLLILAAMLSALSLVACGAAAPAPSPFNSAPAQDSLSTTSRPSAAPPPAAPAAAPMPASGGAAAGEAGKSTASSAAPGTAASASNPAGARAALQLDRRIIRNASLTVTVKDVAPVVDEATRLAAARGGWSAGSQISQVADGKQTATLTLKVPVDQYEDLMRDLRALGKVNTERATSQDVTDEYEDLDAQIANLKILESRYQELLNKASTTNDILAITQKLSEVRGQIERAQGRLNSLKRRTDYSEITLSLVPEGLPVQTPGWQPSAELAAAFKALISLLQILATIAIWVLVAGSPFIAIVGLAIFLWRRHRRSRVRPASPTPTPSGAG